MKRIGVQGLTFEYLAGNQQDLKRDLLLFDTIQYNDYLFETYPEILNFLLKESSYTKQKLREIEVLGSLGYLEKKSIYRENDDSLEPIKRQNLINSINQFFETTIKKLRDTRSMDRIDYALEYTRFMSEFFAFSHSATNNLLDNNNEYIPLLKTKLSEDIEGLDKYKVDTLKVMINRFPTVNNISLEQLKEIKTDDELFQKLQNLRAFIQKLSSQKLEAKYINDEIESKISEYSAALKKHKMKLGYQKAIILLGYAVGTLQDNYIATFSTGLIQLLTACTNYFFDINSLPGKEIAYIIDVNEKLHSIT